jgi:hypothetical protein
LAGAVTGALVRRDRVTPQEWRAALWIQDGGVWPGFPMACIAVRQPTRRDTPVLHQLSPSN